MYSKRLCSRGYSGWRSSGFPNYASVKGEIWFIRREEESWLGNTVCLKKPTIPVKIGHARDIVVGIRADIICIDEYRLFFRCAVLVPTRAGLPFLHTHFHVWTDVKSFDL